MGKMMRAVVVYDIEVNGTIKDAANLDDNLNNWAEEFNSFLNLHDPELNKKINFTQICAAVPLQERRGATGSLDSIVFRGTRGPNDPLMLKKRLDDSWDKLWADKHLDYRGIGDLRKSLGEKQVQVAKKSGISQSLLSKYEKGTVKTPSYQHLKSIAGALNVSLDDLEKACEDFQI